MPDWTYHPLRRPMAAVLGIDGSRRSAIRFLGALSRLPGGRAVIAGFGHTAPPAAARGEVAGVICPSRVGISVGADLAADALDSMPPLGAGLVEVGPITPAAAQELVKRLQHAAGPVAVRVRATDAAAVASTVRGHAPFLVVDADATPNLATLREASTMTTAGVLVREASPADVRRHVSAGQAVIASTSNPSPTFAAALISAGADAVLATPAALIEAGPGWFSRVTAIYAPATSEGRKSKAWIAGLLLGLGMIFGGLGAAIESIGPVLLPYDSSFLGVDSRGLATINPRLVQFLQHDRITLAGTMITIGILYSGLSWFGLRRGQAWARDTLLASGVVGFPTLFYFFAYGYVEPVHVALAAVLFPLFVVAVWRRQPGRSATAAAEPSDREWHRALAGQLLMVLTGFGLVVGGLTISYVGLTAVFVPTDLTYMGTTAHALDEANHRLLSFIAHDRAGFGGALISAGVAILLLAAWGWNQGSAWVWWCLVACATIGFGAALGVHLAVAYTDFWHVAPIYVGIAVSFVSLTLARPFLMGYRTSGR